MQPEPLQRCPMCDYSLVGLPDVHRCPECGLAYDKAMEVIVPRRSWLFWGLLGTVGAWLSWMAFDMVLILGWSSGAMVVFVLTLLTALLYRRKLIFRRRRVVIWAGGILVIGRKRRPELFEWSRIASLRREFVNGVSLFSPDGEKLTFISTVFLGSPANLDGVVMAFNRWKGRKHDDEAAANAGERGIPWSAESDSENHHTAHTGGDG
jgi:hypothetical protein